MRHYRSLCPRRTLAPRTAGRASSSSREEWATPLSTEHKAEHSIDPDWETYRKGERLTTQALGSAYPTPRRTTNRASRKALTMEGHWTAPSLEQVVELQEGILPRELNTLDEMKSPAGRAMFRERETWTQAVGWPTPVAMDGRSGGSRNTEGSKAHAGLSLSDAVITGDSTSGRAGSDGLPAPSMTKVGPRGSLGVALHPRFVEALMSFPDRWTEITPEPAPENTALASNASETPSPPRAPRSSAGSSDSWPTPTVADSSRGSAQYARGNLTLKGSMRSWAQNNEQAETDMAEKIGIEGHYHPGVVALDEDEAARFRAAGVPVEEASASGVFALDSAEAKPFREALRAFVRSETVAGGIFGVSLSTDDESGGGSAPGARKPDGAEQSHATVPTDANMVPDPFERAPASVVATLAPPETPPVPGPLVFPSERRAVEKPGPFIRWAGGKAALAKEILQHLPAKIGTYWEPFLGGGAVFWALAAEEKWRFDWAVLSDANPCLVTTYMQIRDDVERVRQGVSALVLARDAYPDPADHYYAVRDEYNEMGPNHPRLAMCFLYLNKFGFNGLYRTNSSGAYNAPVGTLGKKPLVPGKAPIPASVLFDFDRMRRCAEILRDPRVYVECVSYEEIEALANAPKQGDAIYLDPPYAPVEVEGESSETADFGERAGSYGGMGFGIPQQTALAALGWKLAARRVCVVASNADTALVRRIYGPEGSPSGTDRFGMRRLEVQRSIGASAETRVQAAELLLLQNAENMEGWPELPPLVVPSEDAAPKAPKEPRKKREPTVTTPQKEAITIVRVESNIKAATPAGWAVALEPRTLILADNGGGKTALQQAIELALSGRVSDMAMGRDPKALAELWALAPIGADSLFARAHLSNGAVEQWISFKDPKSGKVQKPSWTGEGRGDLAHALPVRELLEALRAGSDTARTFLARQVEDQIAPKDVRDAIPESLLSMFDDLAKATDAVAPWYLPMKKLDAVGEAAKAKRQGIEAEVKVAEGMVNQFGDAVASESDLERAKAEYDAAQEKHASYLASLKAQEDYALLVPLQNLRAWRGIYDSLKGPDAAWQATVAQLTAPAPVVTEVSAQAGASPLVLALRTVLQAATQFGMDDCPTCSTRGVGRAHLANELATIDRYFEMLERTAAPPPQASAPAPAVALPARPTTGVMTVPGPMLPPVERQMTLPEVKAEIEAILRFFANREIAGGKLMLAPADAPSGFFESELLGQMEAAQREAGSVLSEAELRAGLAHEDARRMAAGQTLSNVRTGLEMRARLSASRELIATAGMRTAKWEAVEKACAAARDELLKKAVSTFEARVQRFMRPGDRFRVLFEDASGGATLRIGLERAVNGASGEGGAASTPGSAVHTALSGAEEALVLMAVASAISQGGLSVVIPEERSYSATRLRSVMRALAATKGVQIVLLSPTAPAGRASRDWLEVELGGGPDETPDPPPNDGGSEETTTATGA